MLEPHGKLPETLVVYGINAPLPVPAVHPHNLRCNKWQGFLLGYLPGSQLLLPQLLAHRSPYYTLMETSSLRVGEAGVAL